MVLLSFSEQSHINKILDGSKRQTTRQERKDPLTPGDIIQLYYKPRMRAGCRNCIVDDCQYSATGSSNYVPDMCCSVQTNFFGEAVVVGVEHINFSKMDAEALEEWAHADGFDSWLSAALWFTGTYSKKLENWRIANWVVITWKPEWLKEVRA